VRRRAPLADGLRAALLAAALLAATGCERPVEPARVGERLAALERPNLVLVVVDTLRADWTTPYGSDPDTSPELARWAEHGILFENVRAQSTWTKMSMASLFTSLWPRTHGIREARDGLAPGAHTLAEALHEAGYRTYAVQTNGWLAQSFGFHQGFERYAFPTGRGAGFGRGSLWAHGERVLAEAIRLLDAHAARDGGDREPFFLYAHLIDVHEYASPPDVRVFRDDHAGAYRNAVRWADDVLRRLRRAIELRGLADRTVLVFTSDHGEAFGEHDRWGHAKDVLTPTLQVPWVVLPPFAMEPVRVDALVAGVDLAPTLLDLAGVPVPDAFEGRSVLPLVAGEPLPDRPSHAALGPPLFPDAEVQDSITDGRWTYARSRAFGGRPAAEYLYDRSVDPREDVNLVALEPEVAARLRARLDAHLAGEPAAGVRARDVRIDPDVEARLRAMGYLGEDEGD
jgi:arylsulfatase A-like enzyme